MIKNDPILALLQSIKVSSVWQQNVKEYGKAHLIDRLRDTCWSSAASSPQHLVFQFKSPVNIARIWITFQGGFVGQPLDVSVVLDGERTFQSWHSFDTRDTNAPQSFQCDCINIIALKLIFPQSSDPFGRITIYGIGFE